jgi:hypothetical protein
VDVLDAYFDAMRSHDWAGLANCLAPAVRRTGPYLDVVEGREAYVEFLAKVIPALPNYTLSVTRTDAIDAATAVVRLTETLDVRGVATEFPEVLFFEFDELGRIAGVDIYVKQIPGVAAEAPATTDAAGVESAEQ